MGGKPIKYLDTDTHKLCIVMDDDFKVARNFTRQKFSSCLLNINVYTHRQMFLSALIKEAPL